MKVGHPNYITIYQYKDILQKQNDKTTKNKISNIKYTKCSPKQSIRESI